MSHSDIVSHSVKAAEEIRQLKFTEPGNDRNTKHRKDARKKQKLAINIVLERSVTLAFKTSPEKNMPQHMERQKQGESVCWQVGLICPEVQEVI